MDTQLMVDLTTLKLKKLSKVLNNPRLIPIVSERYLARANQK